MTIELARRMELVFSGALATRDNIEKLCAAARAEGYRGIVIPSCAVLLAQHLLDQSEAKISCRVGFPYGCMDSDVKRYETELAIDAGAHEIELMPSLAKISDGQYDAVLREIRDAVEAADERPVKVAVEPSRWQGAVLREMVQLVLDSGAQYICTVNSDNGSQQIRLLRELCGSQFGIIGTAADVTSASVALNAGANRVAVQWH